MNQNFSVEL